MSKEKNPGEIQGGPLELSVEELEKVAGGDGIPYFRAYCLYEGCDFECMGTASEVAEKCYNHRVEKSPAHGRFDREPIGLG